jgi:uncharacterized membrane protein
MDILSDPVLTVVPFALFVGLVAVALRTLGRYDEKIRLPFRSARDVLEEHLTRHDISREEYVDRRKAAWPCLPASRTRRQNRTDRDPRIYRV